MIFKKSGRKLNNKFKYGKITLENVRSYKCLGFMVTPSGEIKTGLNDLRIKGPQSPSKDQKISWHTLSLKYLQYYSPFQLHG